ncbi:TolC family protein [Rhizorhabdus histidinilytica]
MGQLRGSGPHPADRPRLRRQPRRQRRCRAAAPGPRHAARHPGQALPTVGASGSVTRSVGADSRTIIDPSTGQTIGSGGDTTVYRGGFDVAWEADLFGGIRRSIQAARATAEAREADLRFTQASIASEVGLNYVQARLAQIRLRIARENLAAQDEIFELVGWRRQAGLVSSLDYEQARQLRAQTAASIPTIENDYATATNRIAVLLGEAPGAITALIDPPASIPLAPGVDAPIPRR